MDTCEYDYESDTWSYLRPAVHPDATLLLRDEYDSGSRRTILFGGWVGTFSDGTYSNGTWGYDASWNTWTNLTPAEHPSARSRQGMAYDAQSARTIIFGGHTNDTTYDNTTRAHESTQNSSTNRPPAVAPPRHR